MFHLDEGVIINYTLLRWDWLRRLSLVYITYLFHDVFFKFFWLLFDRLSKLLHHFVFLLLNLDKHCLLIDFIHLNVFSQIHSLASRSIYKTSLCFFLQSFEFLIYQILSIHHYCLKVIFHQINLSCWRSETTTCLSLGYHDCIILHIFYFLSCIGFQDTFLD